MPKLCLLNDNGAVAKEWERVDESLTVGRGEAVRVKIDDEGLSRRHFMIFREGDDYLLKDLGSRNGTWVEGLRIPTRKLSHDDLIRAGGSVFRFCERSGSSESALEPQRGPHDTVVLSVCA